MRDSASVDPKSESESERRSINNSSEGQTCPNFLVKQPRLSKKQPKMLKPNNI